MGARAQWLELGQAETPGPNRPKATTSVLSNALPKWHPGFSDVPGKKPGGEVTEAQADGLWGRTPTPLLPLKVRKPARGQRDPCPHDSSREGEGRAAEGGQEGRGGQARRAPEAWQVSRRGWGRWVQHLLRLWPGAARWASGHPQEAGAWQAETGGGRLQLAAGPELGLDLGGQRDRALGRARGSTGTELHSRSTVGRSSAGGKRGEQEPRGVHIGRKGRCKEVPRMAKSTQGDSSGWQLRPGGRSWGEAGLRRGEAALSKLLSEVKKPLWATQQEAGLLRGPAGARVD